MKLKKRANGIYYIIFDRSSRRSLKTKDSAEAKKLFAIEKENIRRGKVIELDRYKRIRLSEFIKEYIDGNALIPRRELEVSPETAYNDQNAFNKLIALIGDVPLRLCGQRHISDFKVKCLALGLSRTYVNIMLRSLRAAFNAALFCGYIRENPFLKSRGRHSVFFELDQELPRYLTMEEIKSFFSAIDDREFRMAAAVYVYTGIRRKELVNLHARDIDMANGVIWIRHTKSKRDRQVPINDHLREQIADLKIDIGPLFRWRRADTMSHLFSKYAKAAGIKAGKKVTLHSLRHSFATHLRLQGVQLDEIQKLLGHSSIQTTMIYAKVVDDILKLSTNKLKFNI